MGVVHKVFGSPVAQVTDDALNTAGNMARCYQNTRMMRPKNIIRKTALHTIASQAKPPSRSGQPEPHVETPEEEEEDSSRR